MDMESTKKDSSRVVKASGAIVPPALRQLDVDDFYLMRLLGEGKRLIDVARTLSLSQPAITQRVYKIENSLGFAILDRSKRSTSLTDEGLEICLKMAKVTEFLETLEKKAAKT